MTNPPKFDRAKFEAHMNSLSDEEKQEASNKTLGCLLLIILAALLGYCTLAGDDEDEVETTSATSATKPTILGQALIDASRGDANAADYVKATINSKGHRCARIIDIADAGSGQYGVGCILNQDGSGSANYLIAPRLDSVSKI